MISVLLQDQVINDTFDVSFSYRYSERYEKGMLRWISNIEKVKRHPLHFPSRWFIALGYFSVFVEVVALYRLFRRIRPDILHTINGGYPGAFSPSSAAIAGRLAGVPKITYFITSTTRNPWWYRPVTFFVKRGVTTFVTASKYLWRESGFLRGEADSPGPNWAIISNTIADVEIPSREEVRRGLGIPEDEVVFLCMGDLVKRKGFGRAVDAFADMEEVGTPRSLLIVGEGEEEERLKARIRTKKTGVYRVMTSPKVHPYVIVNASDVLIVPSVGDEDWPNVILIAMKHGVPCIVSNVCGLPEMVGEIGLVFSDSKMLTVRMTDLLDEKGRISIRQRLRARYERLYRQEKIVGKYLELWEGK